MATIAVTSFPVRSYNEIVTNFTAEPYLYASLTRIDDVTGTETPVRPHTYYSGDCMIVSCDGQQVWWDTTVPFDRSVHYRADSCDATVRDTFTRNVVNGWGTPDIGPSWAFSGGVAGDYAVNGTQAVMTMTSVNVQRTRQQTLGWNDATVQVDAIPGVVATGAPISMGLQLRWSAATSYYLAEVQFLLGGLTQLRIRKNVAGTFTTLASTTTVQFSYAAASVFRIKAEAEGSTLRMKAWPTSRPEPGEWALETVLPETTYPTQTVFGVRSILETGNTNALNVTLKYDNFRADSLATSTVQTVSTVSSASSVMPADGDFWLKDPVRPCRDRRVALCAFPPNCSPESGLMFVALDSEDYDSQSTLMQPVGLARPRSINRLRSDAQSSLSIISKTFDDRDDVLKLCEPGEPLFWQGPADYGIPDRYMAVGTVRVTRPLPDHRYQGRALSLPFTTVDRPAGPTTGPCGETIADQCNIYANWDAMETATITYLGMVNGTTGGPGV